MAAEQAQTREAFDALLRELMPNVYYQPPSGNMMQYPCIVYELYMADSKFADNVLYHYKKRYQVTVITPDSDDPVPDKVAALPLTRFLRWFPSANLHHHVFYTYF